MADREHSCCFTGHRPQKLPWGMNENDPRCVKLKAELDARLGAIYELGYRHFICGMAIGCDMYFAEAVLKLREKYGDVTLEAAIPFGDQPGFGGRIRVRRTLARRRLRSRSPHGWTVSRRGADLQPYVERRGAACC